MSLRVKIELAQGDTVTAAQDLATLKQVQPASSALPDLLQMQTEAANPIDTGALSDARDAAAAGHYADAVSLYQQSFHGSTPPAGLATEYYQTLAGTPNGWNQAVSALASQVADNPNDLHAQLAYAEVQTYQPAGRSAGIARLQSLTAYPAVANNAATAWKQALAFLPEDASAVPAYQAYLAKYPDDPTVTGLLAAASAPHPVSAAAAQGDNRAAGFDALNAGQLTQAATLFQAALATTPNDADALGGLGLVRLRQGQTATARSLLQQAIAANPAEQAKWQPALAGADRGAAYQTASAAIAQGNLGKAAAQLNGIISGGGDTAGAEAMLADIRTRQGRLDDAATAWRAVLAQDPNNGPALVGLGTILSQQGDQQGAQTLFQQAESTGQGALVAGAQAELLRSQAAAATDPTVAIALYRAAVAAAPSDPWARLDLARALRTAGQDPEAVQQMAALTAGPTPTDADLQAAALFAAEDGRQADAAALVARLPPAGLTPDMLAIQANGQLAQQIANAQAQSAGNPALTRQLLVTMAAAPDPTGARGAAIATALAKAQDGQGAQLAIEAAVAANPGAGPGARLTYAGALLSNGQDMAAGQLVQSLQASGGLTADQQATLQSLRDGLAIRASDRLAAQGQLAQAYDQLSPGLAAAPQDPALEHRSGPAVPGQSSAATSPGDQPGAAASRSEQSGCPRRRARRRNRRHRLKTANALVQAGQTAQPNEPRIWMMSAELDRAQGHNDAALADLRTAQTLRQQQLIAQSGGGAAVALATAAPVAVNPFDNGTSQAVQADAPASILGTAGGYTATPLQTDPMTLQIAQQIDTLQQSQSPSVQAGISIESRSGSTGLDQLQTLGAPITGTYAPFGTGALALTATPTFLSAGQVSGDASSQSRFGTDALGTTTQPGSQSAVGIGLKAAYELPWLKTSFGSTPIGFRTQNLIGSVELDPQLTSLLRLSVSAERQPVTDSLLSYASVDDPRTGVKWGGVLRDRAAAQLSLSMAPATSMPAAAPTSSPARTWLKIPNSNSAPAALIR